MKRRHLRIVIANILMLLVLFGGAQSSDAKQKQDSQDAEDATTKQSKSSLDLEISLGYRIDHLNWNIAGGGVNVLSELIWEDLGIRQIKGSRRYKVEVSHIFSLYMRDTITYGTITKGRNQDSDYNGNNRTLEFSRSNNDANGGYVLDLSSGIGVQVRHKLKESEWVVLVSPLIGYSYHTQNLQMTNGFQTIPSNGTFSGLNSTYDTEWRGPWIGLDLSANRGKKNHFFTSFEYHWTTYKAQAKWNLRTDFSQPVSFEHEANGTGIVLSTGWAYLILSNLSVNTTIEYQSWTTKAGIDTTFLSNGTTSATRLNQVNWESRSLSLGLQYRFE